MSQKQVQGLLKIASEQVPCGIYCIRKGNYYEMRHDRMSPTKTKEARRMYRAQGMKVFANGI